MAETPGSVSQVQPGSRPKDALSAVFSPVVLPSGAALPNRLVKVAMYEHLASLLGGPPNERHFRLYSRWARGNWGMIVTGNVQVCADHLTLGKDMVIPRSITDGTLRPFKLLSQAMRGQYHDSQSSDTQGSLIVMQLSHAGRQSPLILGGRWPFEPALAPSAIPLGRHSRPAHTKDGWLSGLLVKAMFQMPRPMAHAEIDEVIDAFTRGSTVALNSGFDGVQLHAAHGYLISQFMSSTSNRRHDEYSVHIAPLGFLRRIVDSIRAIVPPTFVVGVKVSSTDYVEAGTSSLDEDGRAAAERRALEHVTEIACWGLVDFIEISGGDYENPDFMTTSRQAFFAHFARLARSAIQSLPSTGPRPHPLVLLTGGLRSSATLSDILSNEHADLLGIGRGSTLCPELPRLLAQRHQSGEGCPDDVLFPKTPPLTYPDTPLTRAISLVSRALGLLPLPKLIGAGVSMAWYTAGISEISYNRDINMRLGPVRAILQMWAAEMRTVVVLLLVAALMLVGGVLSWFRAGRRWTELRC